MQLKTFALLFIMATMTYAAKVHYNIDDAPALFEKFIMDYNRHYKNEADREVHYQAFVKTLKEINEDNEKNDDAFYDINKFADYTEEETKSLFGYLPYKKNIQSVPEQEN